MLAQNIRDLWNRGKYWEIFKFSSGDFTALELAKNYSALTKVYQDSPEDKRIIDNAFSALNAPLTRQFYEGCRMVMQRIRQEIGDARFKDVENRIWLDLWTWVSERWQEPPDEIINAIKTKYRQHRRSKKGATEQTQTMSGEGQNTADLDSVMAAEALAKEIICQSCGKFDHTLRVVAFPYVISILVASFKRVGEAGIFCHSCRCSKSLKWAIVSLLFGWWGIAGFFWTVGALIDNFRGGKMPKENNEPLVAKLVSVNMTLGRIAEAKAALSELLKYGTSKESILLKQEFDEKYPTTPPAAVDNFRFGYLSVVFAILGVYVIAGFNMFGGSSTPSTTPSQYTPVYPSPTVPAPTPTPRTTPTPTPTAPAPTPNLNSQITANKARLSQLESQLNALETEMNGYESKMDVILKRYPSRQLPEPYLSQYNTLVRQFNSSLATYNSVLGTYNNLLNTTNNLIDQYNRTR